MASTAIISMTPVCMIQESGFWRALGKSWLNSEQWRVQETVKKFAESMGLKEKEK